MGDHRLDAPWDFKWDVIQFNAGLHDLKYLNGGKMDKARGRQVSSLEEYRKNLRDIVAYFHKIAPEAEIIFATTTPVPEGEIGRVAGDAFRFNEVALKVIHDYSHIIVNDLYTLTKPEQTKWWTRPGNVHFNAEGQKGASEPYCLGVILNALKK